MFENVTIVGVGLLGASLGLALKERRLAARITGVGRSGSASLQTALTRNAIDQGYTDLAAALKSESPDLVILATPVRQFPAAFETLRNASLAAHSLITDVGSTKAQVMAWAAEYLHRGGATFVGSHPMAGSEKRGPEAARADLYQNALCLICPGDAADERGATEKIEALWRGVGMRTIRLEPEAHDRWVATISHLPHALAFSLVNAAAKHPERLQAIAGGFLDTTRIASSDVDMWTDIFLTNRAALLGAIDEFTGDLAQLRSAVAAGDEPAIRRALSAAKRTRDELLDRRRSASKSNE